MRKQYIKFKCTHQKIERTDDFFVVGGSQRYLYAQFDFCEDWAGEKQYAVFTGDLQTFRVPIVDGECEVPWEMLLAKRFFVGCEAGERITSNAVEVEVHPCGAPEETGTPRNPTPTLQSQIGNLGNLKTENKGNLVEAVNEVFDKSGGSGGGSVEIDKTLTKEGAAADAKAVGDEFNRRTETIIIDVPIDSGDTEGTVEEGIFEKVMSAHNQGKLVVCRTLDNIMYFPFGPDPASDPLSFIFISFLEYAERLIFVSRRDCVYAYFNNYFEKFIERDQPFFDYLCIGYDYVGDDNEPDILLQISAAYDNNAKIPEVYWENINANSNASNFNVRHKYIADGIEDNDAVNVRQLNGKITTPSTAEVGQTLVVKEVDENGKPTDWECTDLPAGGASEKWKLLHDVVMEEAVAANTGMEFDTTGSKGLIVGWYCPACEATCGYATFKLNGNKPGGGFANQPYFWSGILTGTAAVYYNFRIEALGDSAVISMMSEDNKKMNAHWWDGVGLYNTIDSIALTHYSGTYPANLKFRIWGRK